MDRVIKVLVDLDKGKRVNLYVSGKYNKAIEIAVSQAFSKVLPSGYEKGIITPTDR